jgi:hypothetical protein
MKPTANGNSSVLPEARWAEVEAAAVDEHRAVDDVVRDLIERGLNERRWKLHAAQEQGRARTMGVPDDDVPLGDDYRQAIRAKVAQGVRSLREGKGADGESFMAAMDAELAELERQGHM